MLHGGVNRALLVTATDHLDTFIRAPIEQRQDIFWMIAFLSRENLFGAIGQQSARQRAPGHGRDLFRQALVERAVAQAIQLGQTDFDLVDQERHGAGLQQRRHLRRCATSRTSRLRARATSGSC